MRKISLSILALSVAILSGCATQITYVPSPEELAQQNHLVDQAEAQAKAGNTAAQLNSLRQAESIGSAKAANTLGQIYSQGVIAPQDREQAFQHFSTAAKLGSTDAQITSAMLNLYGIGTVKNEDAGLDLLKEAAKTDKRAKRELGLMYGSLRLPFLKDEKKGLKYLKEAAGEGDADAAYYLSVLADRVGDKDEAASALKEGARLGQPKAQLSLGRQSMVSGQYMQAQNLFLSSAKANDSEAMFELAKGLDKGVFPVSTQVKGSTPTIEAYVWLLGANSQKHLQARDMLKLVEPKLPTDAEGKKAIEATLVQIQSEVKPYDGNK